MAIGRPNFHALLSRQVTKIVTEKTEGMVRVIGVEVSSFSSTDALDPDHLLVLCGSD
jgi:hypothetical protein